MTAKTRVNLKAAFETGDTPDGDDYEDLIDSFLSLSDASAQSITSPITTPSHSTGTLSATTVYSNVQYVRGLATHENPYAEAFADVTAITSVEATAGWVAISGALTAPNASAFQVSGKDLTYTGGVTARFGVSVVINARLSANVNQWFGIAKNGTVVSSSITKTRIPTASLKAIHMQSVVELKGNDVLGLRTQNPDGPIDSPEVFSVVYLVEPKFWG